jgi:hypothetical protein
MRKRKRKSRKQFDRSVATEIIKLITALASLLTALIKLLADE